MGVAGVRLQPSAGVRQDRVWGAPQARHTAVQRRRSWCAPAAVLGRSCVGMHGTSRAKCATLRTAGDKRKVSGDKGEVSGDKGEMSGPIVPPPLAQARPRSQKSGQNGGSTPTPCLDKAVHARDTCDSQTGNNIVSRG